MGRSENSYERKNSRFVRGVNIDTYGQDLEQVEGDEGERLLVRCRKINYRELNAEETIWLRIFYWAAMFGLKKYIRLMVVKLRWSPYIKSFRNQSVLMAAIIGKNVEVCRMLINEYKFEADENVYFSNDKTMKKKWKHKSDKLQIFGKDNDDNNILHYCYIMDLP